MTPDDIAAIRRGYLSYSGYPTPDIAELCDALEAAWIRADDLAQSLEGETRRVGRERERAERAEQSLLLERCRSDEWKARAERAEAAYETVKADMAHEQDRAVRAEAALARVRAIIDHNGESRSGSALTSDIRAAIEGDNQ